MARHDRRHGPEREFEWRPTSEQVARSDRENRLVCQPDFRITAQTTEPREAAVAQHPGVDAHFRPKAKPAIGDKRESPLRPDAKGCTASLEASGLLRSPGAHFLESIKSLRPSNRGARRLREPGPPSQTPWWRVEKTPDRPSSIDRARAPRMLLWAYGTPDTWQLLRLNTCRVESVRLSPIRQNRKWQEAREMPRMCQKSLVGPQKSQQRFPRGVALRCGQSSQRHLAGPRYNLRDPARTGVPRLFGRKLCQRCCRRVLVGAAWAVHLGLVRERGYQRALSACRSTTVPHDSLTDRRRGCWPFSRLRGVGFFATKYRAIRYLFRSLGYLSRRSTYGTPTTGPGSTGPRP